MCLSAIRNSPLGKQVLVISTVLSLMIGNGMNTGMSSSMLNAVQAPNSPFEMSTEFATWIVTAVGVGSLVASLALPYLSNRYGRCNGMVSFLMLPILAPFLACFITNIYVLIFSRFFSGMSHGGAGVMCLMVIGEYTDPEYRGIFLTLKSGFLFLGVVIVHSAGYVFHWKTLYLTLGVFYIYTVLIMFFCCPESPSWLITKKKYDACADAFYWLRGKTDKTTLELTAMVTAQKLKSFEEKPFLREAMDFLQKFKKKNFLKPFVIDICLMALLEFSGRHYFPSYAMQIVHEMDNDRSRSMYYTLCFDLMMTVGGILSAISVKKLKRRTLLFGCSLISVLILYMISVIHYLRSTNDIPNYWNYVVIVLVAIYMVIVNIGCIPMAFTLLGEIYPLEHRASGLGLSGVMMSVFMIVTLKLAPVLMARVKLSGMFAFFGSVMLICVIVLYFTLPETKDRTLQEIEDYFDNGTYQVAVKESELKKMMAEVSNDTARP